jgi:hypothetical protein
MPYNISIQFESIPQHNSLLWQLNRIGDTATTSVQPKNNEVNFISDMVGHWYIAPHPDPDMPASMSRITFRVQLAVLDPDSLEGNDDEEQTDKERKRVAQSATWLGLYLRKQGMTQAMTLLKKNAEQLWKTPTTATASIPMSTNTADSLMEERQLSRDDAQYTVFENQSNLFDEKYDKKVARKHDDGLDNEPDKGSS